MQEDKHGRIWFRSFSGRLSYWANDSIYSIRANDSIVSYLGNSLVTSFYIDSGDTIWCGLRASLGCFKILPGYTEKELKYINLNIKGTYIMRLEGDHVICGNVLGKNIETPWYFMFNREKLTGQSFQSTSRIKNLRAAGIGEGRVLITNGRNIVLWSGSSTFELPELQKLVRTEVSFIKQEGTQFWIGSYGSGVRSVSIVKDKMIAGSAALLNGLTVTDLGWDNEGGTWFTTLEQGIYYASADHFMIKTSVADSGQFTRMKLTALRNCLLSSQANGKVNLYYPDSTLRNIPVESPKLRAVLAAEGTPFPIIFNTGKEFIHNQFQAHAFFRSGGQAIPLFDTLKNRMSVDWFGLDSLRGKIFFTDRFRLYVLSEKEPTLRFLGTLPVRVYSIYIDKAGILWMGTLNGLWSFSEGKFTYHGSENPFMSYRINDMITTKDGLCWFATLGNGVILKKDGKFTKFTMKDGLSSNNCECMVLDKQNTLWIGTKNGLSSLRQDGSGKWIGNKYSLGGDLLSQKISELKLCGSDLWIRVENLLLTHHLPMQSPGIQQPPVFITSFSINNKSYRTEVVPQLDYNENSFRVQYVGLSYRSFGKLTYEYKLDGLDTAWHLSQNTSMFVAFLAPGNYTFRVRIVGENNIRGETAEVRFVIKKPFWDTWLFRALILSLFAGIILVTVRILIRSIRRKDERKSALSLQIAGLEMKAIRAQMNPHFIFNAINSIQNHILKNDSRTAQDYLAKFARLIRSVLENSKSENIPLVQEIETLQLYIELEQMRAHGRFTCRIEVEPALPVYEVLIPPLLLQPFVENAILHGLWPLQDASGVIEIRIRKRNEMLECVIEDNGVGRKASLWMKKHTEATHKSMGLSLTEERIKALNTFNNSVANLTIEDKVDTNGKPCGTLVTLLLPLIIAKVHQ